MAFNVGVNVVEVDGRSSPTIADAPISTAGFLIRSERGPRDLAVRVRGVSDFVSTFGGFAQERISGTPSGPLYGAHALRGFFENGGSDAVVLRVVSRSAMPATVTLPDRESVNALTLSAGARGLPDPGEWGNSLRVLIGDRPSATSQVPAQLLGQAEPFNPGSGPFTLRIIPDGDTSGMVEFTLTAAEAAQPETVTADAFAARINRAGLRIRAVVTPDRRLLIYSTQTGAGSRIRVEGDLAAPLGFSTNNADTVTQQTARSVVVLQNPSSFVAGSGLSFISRATLLGAVLNLSTPATAGAQLSVLVDQSTTPQIVALETGDLNSATAAVTAINRQARGFEALHTPDGRILLTASSIGSTSRIVLGAVTAGATDAAPRLGLATGTATATAGAETLRLVSAVSETGRYVMLDSALPATLTPHLLRAQSQSFDLSVLRDGMELERFEALTMQPGQERYVVSTINHPDRGSRLITARDLRTSVSGVRSLPRATASGPVPLASGTDGTAVPTPSDYIGDPALHTGLYAFDRAPIQLLCCTDNQSLAVTTAAIAYCEARGDAMFVGCPGFGLDLAATRDYASSLRRKNAYGALYAPWISITNPLDRTGAEPTLFVPPVGHILGVYARIGETRGVFKAPAGDEAVLRNALGTALELTDVEHTDLVKNSGVNGVRAVPGAGVILDASRTLSTDSRWLFVNVRRLFNFVKASLRDGLRFVAQEPNSDELRRTVRFNVITPFLLNLWRRGAFGSSPPAQVFTVKCDAENNPPQEVNQGNFNVEVYFYPVRPAETIVIIVGQQDSGAQVAEN